MAKRLISPAGFLLSLICFAFPFLAVSCEPPERSLHTTAEYIGWDFVFGGQPDLAGPGADRFAGIKDDRDMTDSMRADPQPAAILAFVVIAGGVTLAFAPRPQTRSAAALSAGVLASLLLVTNQITVHNRAVSELTEPGSRFARARVFDVTPPRYGFWLALTFLLAVAGYNAYEIVQARRRASLRNRPPTLEFPPAARQWPDG
jgi:hypothetical protein